MQEEQEQCYIWRKIEVGRKYRIWRKDYAGVTYYNIQTSQKNYDDTQTKFYIPVIFKKGVDIQNGTDIIIKRGIENLRENKKLPDKDRPYYPVYSYMINDFEIVESQEKIEQDAFSEYRDNLDDMEIEITDDFLD